ncbi:uncharacterized protein LOC118179422 [Stegodyphus dumicola]|uniref:uncharacterized protein LOC118179422 n=1 Tax=Stegodyphus dumicola TaxID=202533 RepID=UPI0015ABD912|nr:uncharacterized protein LOC118179422 [Stegodyphus dumicola]
MRWARILSDGRQETADLQRPGQAHKVVTDKLIRITDMAIKANGRRNIREVADELSICIGSVHNTASNVLKYEKVCCQWVPHILSEHHKKQQMGLNLQYLVHYTAYGDDVL